MLDAGKVSFVAKIKIRIFVYGKVTPKPSNDTCNKFCEVILKLDYKIMYGNLHAWQS
jgi:hypothetical protein